MLRNREGQSIPQVTFRTRTSGEWQNVTTDDIFRGKTVVIFSLPGAFTPQSMIRVPQASVLPAMPSWSASATMALHNSWARSLRVGMRPL